MIWFDNISHLIMPMLKGTGTTLTLFAATLIISIPLGILIALGRMSKIKPLSWFLRFYIWFFRGSPLLLQVFFICYGVPIITEKFFNYRVVFDSLPAAIIAFGLNYAAYLAEIFRAGIQSIDKGQYEAADVLGLTKKQTFWKIIRPQMIKRVLPPLSNEVITLIKDTALVSAISLEDLLKVARAQATKAFDFTPYVVAAAFYLIMTFVIQQVFRYFEKKYEYYR